MAGRVFELDRDSAELPGSRPDAPERAFAAGCRPALSCVRVLPPIAHLDKKSGRRGQFHGWTQRIVGIDDVGSKWGASESKSTRSMDSSCVHDKQREIANVVKNRLVRGSIAAAAAVVPLAGVSALAASPAGAAAKGITCTKLSGSANTSTGADKTKVTGCNGNTGASGKSKGMITDTTVTIKWANGKSTSFTQSATGGVGVHAAERTHRGRERQRHR